MEVLLWTAFVDGLCGWVAYLNAPGHETGKQLMPVVQSTPTRTLPIVGLVGREDKGSR